MDRLMDGWVDGSVYIWLDGWMNREGGKEGGGGDREGVIERGDGGRLD